MPSSPSLFGHRSAGTPPPGARPAVSPRELAVLRRRTLRITRGFALLNGVPLALTVVLACTAGGLLGTKVLGQFTVGMLLGVVQGTLLLWTAARFDRRAAARCDAEAERLRAGHRTEAR
ncbi:DUF485 domain-containing protein [Kitasatospora sp. NPDC059722]|uniref:DUF485 domain-containing protein n=1 Tax=unclassified Kitasatospora TaxID=2633591 RepID=UPI003647D10D